MPTAAEKVLKSTEGDTNNCGDNDCNNKGKDALDKFVGGGSPAPSPQQT
jgi:hypothetical protein